MHSSARLLRLNHEAEQLSFSDWSVIHHWAIIQLLKQVKQQKELNYGQSALRMHPYSGTQVDN